MFTQLSRHLPVLTKITEARDQAAYKALGEHPTQVESNDGVDLLAPRIGYKRGEEDIKAYKALGENPTQVESNDGVDLLAPRIGKMGTRLGEVILTDVQ
jgi:hypothetical protein